MLLLLSHGNLLIISHTHHTTLSFRCKYFFVIFFTVMFSLKNQPFNSAEHQLFFHYEISEFFHKFKKKTDCQLISTRDKHDDQSFLLKNCLAP